MKPLGKKWHIFSIQDSRFDIDGYSEPDKDHHEEALAAVLVVEEILKSPIPADSHLILVGTEQ